MKPLTFEQKITVLDSMINHILVTNYCICWALVYVLWRDHSIKRRDDVKLSRFMYTYFIELHDALQEATKDRSLAKNHDMDTWSIIFDKDRDCPPYWNKSNKTDRRIEFLTNVKLMMIDHQKQLSNLVGFDTSGSMHKTILKP